MVSDLYYYNRGTKYLVAGKYDKALAAFKREPWKSKELYLNMGNTLRRMGRFTEAEKCYISSTTESTLDFDGRGGLYPPALSNLGLLAYGVGEDALAINYYRAAIEKEPRTYDALWNCSTALLREWCSGGPLNPEAWEMYDYRFRALAPLRSIYPMWNGEFVDTIVVIAEQGLGDKLMFSRYFDLLASRCNRLILQMPKCLWGLYKYECVEELPVINAYGVPLASLAKIFGAVSGEWLSGGSGSGGLKVCCEWAGSKTHANDKYRSCMGRYFSDLGVELYNIRPDAEVVQGVTNVRCKDFAESYEFLRGMDLVISVDTSLVHLAGSMGLKTWMLQPLRETDFRWGLPASKRLYGMDVERNIWYDSVAVLENHGWDSLFKNVKERLECIEQ